VLWYKAWLETRARFLISLASVVVILVFFVHHAESILPREPKGNTYELFFFAHFYLAGLWLLSVILLGMGGLLREKTAGVSSFTLALPVSRAHLLWVRIATGALESIALGILPWVAILVVSALAGRPFFISQACFYVLLLIGGGLVYFAIAVLISTLFEGEYTAPAVAYGIVILVGIISGSINKLRPFLDLWRFITADNYYNKSTHLLSAPVPWFGIAACLSVATLLLFASVRVTERREF
jgi:ABC-2 type transport system permease protein